MYNISLNLRRAELQFYECLCFKYCCFVVENDQTIRILLWFGCCSGVWENNFISVSESHNCVLAIAVYLKLIIIRKSCLKTLTV